MQLVAPVRDAAPRCMNVAHLGLSMGEVGRRESPMHDKRVTPVRTRVTEIINKKFTQKT